jgi:precorrin isomerase
MGLEIVVLRQGPCPLEPILARLEAAGIPASVVMMDNVLRAPKAPLPAAWRDARLRTPAGLVTLRRHPQGIAVVVFGNADSALQAVQRRVAEALQPTS